jgi:hypothetical protein
VLLEELLVLGPPGYYGQLAMQAGSDRPVVRGPGDGEVEHDGARHPRSTNLIRTLLDPFLEPAEVLQPLGCDAEPLSFNGAGDVWLVLLHGRHTAAQADGGQVEMVLGMAAWRLRAAVLGQGGVL